MFYKWEKGKTCLEFNFGVSDTILLDFFSTYWQYYFFMKICVQQETVQIKNLQLFHKDI